MPKKPYRVSFAQFKRVIVIDYKAWGTELRSGQLLSMEQHLPPFPPTLPSPPQLFDTLSSSSGSCTCSESGASEAHEEEVGEEAIPDSKERELIEFLAQIDELSKLNV